MAGFFGSIADKLGYKQIPCRMKGCDQTWMLSVKERGLGEPPPRMCDRCHARYEALQDQSIKCATEGCEDTFTWTRFAQLEAELRAEPKAPRHLCAGCLEKAKALGDKQLPCRMKGCT